MRNFFLFVFTAFLCTYTAATFAQDEAQVESQAEHVRVIMYDGSSRIGELLESDKEEIVLQTVGIGLVAIPKYLVKGLATIDEREYKLLLEAFEGREMSLNPQSSRYFFAPSGIQLRQGEGYFQSNIALNSISFGVNENVTIGGLLSFVGAGGSVKIGKQLNETTYISCGGIGFMDYYGEFDSPIGLVFANMTWGTEDRNVTVNLGTGTAFEDGRGTIHNYTTTVNEWGGERYIITEYDQEWVRPLLFNVSAMNRISENRWFITENYFVRNLSYSTRITGANLEYSYLPSWDTNTQNSGLGILSMGIRNMSTTNGWLWDYGMVGVIGDDFGFAAPWVSATLAF